MQRTSVDGGRKPHCGARSGRGDSLQGMDSEPSALVSDRNGIKKRIGIEDMGTNGRCVRVVCTCAGVKPRATVSVYIRRSNFQVHSLAHLAYSLVPGSPSLPPGVPLLFFIMVSTASMNLHTPAAS